MITLIEQINNKKKTLVYKQVLYNAGKINEACI